MPNQCVHCKKIYPDASPEVLKGCSCGSKFFFYINQERLNKANQEVIIEFKEEDKKTIEQDIREIMNIEDEEIPVILDLESVRVLSPGKFQIDIVNLFDKNRPIIYKLEEGKYIIDLASGLEKIKKDDLEVKKE
ncbi:MAG: Zn-ribbon containing protein [Nanoarchaeota archaeon]